MHIFLSLMLRVCKFPPSVLKWCLVLWGLCFASFIATWQKWSQPIYKGVGTKLKGHLIWSWSEWKNNSSLLFLNLWLIQMSQFLSKTHYDVLLGIIVSHMWDWYLIFLCGLQDAKSHLSWWSVQGSLQVSSWQPHIFPALDSGNNLSLYLFPVRISGQKKKKAHTWEHVNLAVFTTSEKHMYYFMTHPVWVIYVFAFPLCSFPVQAKLWISARNVLQVSSFSFVFCFCLVRYGVSGQRLSAPEIADRN